MHFQIMAYCTFDVFFETQLIISRGISGFRFKTLGDLTKVLVQIEKGRGPKIEPFGVVSIVRFLNFQHPT